MNGSITYDARRADPFSQGPFSPYHDDNGVVDFFDDDAQRVTSIIACVLAVHFALIFMLSPHFIMPDLKPDEPDVVPVQIITFDPTPQAEPEPAPEPEIIRPAIPAPVAAPRTKPRPKPTPPLPVEPQPVFTPPPAPEPEPEPEPIPDPIFTPPPEIISQPVIEPEPIVEPDPVVQPDPIVKPESVIEPTPMIQEPLPELVIPEPIPDPIVPQPITPEPIMPEPSINEPLPEILPDVLPEPVIEQLLPDPTVEPDPAPFTTPDPIDTAPTPGPIIEDLLPDLPPLEELPPIAEPLPETLPDPTTTPPTPETIDPPDVIEETPKEPEFITTAPSILASPDAPVTPQETNRAVPQSQSNPLRDLLERPVGLPPANTEQGGSTISGPTTGGGNETIPGGGTRRSAPGSGGWTLAPSGRTSPGAGYDGLVLDIRCREAGRSHLDCPEYLRQFQGRDSRGFESFSPHSNGTVPNAGPRGYVGASSSVPIGGGTSPWERGIGNNSINNGGPSTTVLSDPGVDFSREFLNRPIPNTQPSGRLRDLLKEPKNDKKIPNWMLPENLPTPPPE